MRELMQEVFGAQNHMATVTFKTSIGLGGTHLDRVYDQIVWFAKDKARLKYRPLFNLLQRGEQGATRYNYLQLPDGTTRSLTGDVRNDESAIPKGSRFFTDQGLTSRRIGSEEERYTFEFEGKPYRPIVGTWRTTRDGMERVRLANRILQTGSQIRFKKYFDDFGAIALTNFWEDVGGGIQSRADPKVYVVQTNNAVIQRCMLMTTDPGDLVFDPTCGSGTTAYVAEQWGRRWITCDTSRVAVTLAKQRLMTGTFDYYQLAHADEGVGSGFKYKTVPHVTLKSITNNPEIKPRMTRAAIDAAIAKYADQETLYDQPLIDRSKARVTGPFTVEAVPAATVMPLDDIDGSPQRKQGTSADMADTSSPLLALRAPNNDVARRGETVRQSEWRDELLKTGIRGRGGQRIEFSRVEVLGGTRWLHADAETKGEKPERAVISFGPEHAPLEQKQVARALDEAESLRPKPKLVIFAAFQFDPEAAKDIDETNWPGVTLLKAQMNADLLTDDLKKKRTSNDSYWLIGQPDVEVRKLPERAASSPTAAQYQVEIHGFDYYNTRTGAIDSGDTTKIVMWLLDTDYDGRSIYPRQVFFPMAGEKDGWARLAKNLKAEIDEDLIEEYRGTTSLPFEAGTHGRVAVKIVDDRGIESLRIVSLD